jgi:hypothetical protein
VHTEAGVTVVDDSVEEEEES